MDMFNNYGMHPLMYQMYANSHFNNGGKEQEPSIVRAFKIIERLERKELKKKLKKDEEEKKKKDTEKPKPWYTQNFSPLQVTAILTVFGPPVVLLYAMTLLAGLNHIAQMVHQLPK